MDDIAGEDIQSYLLEQFKNIETGKLDIAANLLQIGTVIKTFADFIKIKTKLETHISTIEDSEVNDIRSYLDEIKDEKIDEMYHKEWANATKTEQEKKESFIMKLKKHHSDLCNEAVNKAAFASFLSGIVQVVQLKNAFEALRDASNIINDQQKYISIEENIQRMRNLLIEISQIYQETPLSRNIDRKSNLLNTVYNRTVALISELEVNVNGCKQKLNLVANNAMVTGISNLTNAAAQAYQLVGLWDNISRSTSIFGICGIVANVVLTCAHVKSYVLSQDMISELQQEISRIQTLKQQIQNIMDDLENILDTDINE